MYAAKRKLSMALLYDPALDSSSAQTLTLLGDLRRAVEQDELRLYLQPRWRTRHQGVLPRRWCAGSTRSAAWCRPWNSFRLPSRRVLCAS